MASVMATTDMEKIVSQARAGFNAGKTRTKEARRRNLEAMIRLIDDHRADMAAASFKDLHKPQLETYMGEVEMAKSEAMVFLTKLDEIVEPTNAGDGSLVLIGKKAFINRDPYGVCLIMGAWNYPVQLVLVPLIGAIAAGNAVVIKPSELSTAVAELFEVIIPQYLDPECFPVVNGGPDVAQALLKQRFDHILYTGGCNVAKIVMRAAAEHLTPVTLELGGKCPAYVDARADPAITAKRIVWGKFMNAGQTCIAPDYVMCDTQVKDKLIEELKKTLRNFYGEDIKRSADYGRIVTERHFDRVVDLLKKQEKNVVFGGAYDRDDKYIEPTILDNITFKDPVVCEEIFGPLLPVVPVRNADEAIHFINSGEKPLALYLFCEGTLLRNRFVNETSSGSILVNDTMIQATVKALPFGGVGNSGMGCYHGKFSIDTFSHQKACLVDPSPRQSEMTMGIRYPPYSSTKEAIACFLMRKPSPNELWVLKLIKYAIVFAIIAYGFRALGLDTIFRG